MSNLAGATGAITTIAGVAFSVAALGLTLEFVNRAVDRATPQPQGKRRKYKPIFDVGNGYNQKNNNLFNPMPQKKGKNTDQYGDFFGGYSY